MSRIKLHYPPGATPLDPNEMGGLIPQYITAQAELNLLERENILEAATWAFSGRRHDCLNTSFCLELHRRMFHRVWKWAGKIRTTDKNLGAPKEQVLIRLKLLFDDTAYWLKEGTYEIDETGARFHHRLVLIHPFANGNGRHARLMTDVLLSTNGESPFTWGQTDLYPAESSARQDYISALKLADQGDYSALKKFVIS